MVSMVITFDQNEKISLYYPLSLLEDSAFYDRLDYQLLFGNMSPSSGRNSDRAERKAKFEPNFLISLTQLCAF